MNYNCQPVFEVHDIVSIITLVLNIIIFIINIILMTKNRLGDVKRSIEYNFYELTLIKALKEYFDIIGIVNKNRSDLINEYKKTDDVTKCRKLAETYIKILDGIYEKSENELSPYLIGFSEEAGSEIHKVVEEYYDATTEILSEYSQPSMNYAKLLKIDSSYSKNTKNLITKIYMVVKRCCPK
jgi:hypothetical protein